MQNTRHRVPQKWVEQKEYIRNAISQTALYKEGYKKIMIVDDCQDTLMALKSIISRNSNINVSVYDNEYYAFEQFFDEMPDLLIIDINLKYLNGFKFHSIIKQISLFDIPIIFISQDKDQRKNMKKNSKSTFLKKPINKETLIHGIENLLL